MRHIIHFLFGAMLIASAQCVSGPVPDPGSGLALLRRAFKAARSPVPQSGGNVPFKIDKEWCVWSPKGTCWLNEAATKAWEYMKVKPPVYKWDDYPADEGVYASGEDAYDEYEALLYDLYEVINKHAPYNGYDYDYEKYIDNYKDKYCVWKQGGDCWFNDLVKYINDQWKDPYKEKRTVRRQSGNWSVYATSTGIQADYALWAWDLLSTVNKNGPLDLARDDVEDSY